MKQCSTSTEKATREFNQMVSKQDMIDLMYQTIKKGKAGLDAMLLNISERQWFEPTMAM